MARKSTGEIGEDAAVAFLVSKKYKILDRNFKIRYGELDIIAIHKNTLVFVEVKTRRSGFFGSPLEAITFWKLRSIRKAALYYKMVNKHLPEQLRMDAISVLLRFDDTVESIQHVENITGY